MKILNQFLLLTNHSIILTGDTRNTLYSDILDHSCAFIGLGHSFRFLRDDPTFIPNGTACEDGKKMCVNQDCRSLPKGCPENCPGEKVMHPYTGEIFPAFILGTWEEQK